MTISHKSFRNLAILLAIVAIALLPMWPYSRWGYMPFGVIVFLLAIMGGIKALERTN